MSPTERPLSTRCQLALAEAKAISDALLESEVEKHLAVERGMQISIAELTQKLSDALDRIKELEGEEPRFPGDPGEHRLYVGQVREGGDPSSREAYYGHVVGIYRSYMEASQISSGIARCKRDLDKGRLPSISFKCPASWDDMAAGKQDAWVKQLMDGLVTLFGPIWLTLYHEPTDNVDGAGNTAASYKAMYQHIYPMKPANVALIPILQSGPFDNVGGQDYQGLRLTDWIDPAAADVIGYDIYNHWHQPPGTFYKWRDVPSMLRFADVVAQAFPGKPQGIFEYGCRTRLDAPGMAANWLKDYHAGCVTRGDVVCMQVYDSSLNVNDGGTPWALDYENNERLDAFKATLTAPGTVYLP